MRFRGSTEPSSINVAEATVEENDQEEEADLTLDDLSDEACEPTRHELHCKASVKGWAGRSYCQCSLRVQQCRLVSYVHCAQTMPCIGARSVDH